MRPRSPQPDLKERSCYFCTHAIDDIDYKDVRQIQRFTSAYGKIVPRRRSGTCLRHQRSISQAIKRARIMALVPFLVR
ncbi:MAG: 30S ribosomal protein S18 [Candidatus Kerfeldbacteria bacterium]|nr:30S ribosomal protein S18 [Candidatus Kerfeldbacteria bacterium]